MEVKVTYDQDRIPAAAVAQIEYADKDYIKIETLYSIDQLDDAMEFFRRINRQLEKFFSKNPEEKVYSDTCILVNTNTVSICLERRTIV